MDKMRPPSNHGILLADMAWSKNMGRIMNSFRLKSVYCDVLILAIDGAVGSNYLEEIRAHSVVLSAASPILKEIIDHQENERIVQIAEIQTWLWDIILRFIYTGEVLIPISNLHKLVQVEAVAEKLQIKQMQCAAQEAMKFAKKLHERNTPFSQLKSQSHSEKEISSGKSMLSIQFSEDNSTRTQPKLLDNHKEVTHPSNAPSCSSISTKTKAAYPPHLDIAKHEEKLPSPRYEQITPEIETTSKSHFFCTSPISEDEDIPSNVQEKFGNNYGYNERDLTLSEDALLSEHVKWISANSLDPKLLSNKASVDPEQENKPNEAVSYFTELTDPEKDEHVHVYNELYTDEIPNEEPSLENLEIEVSFEKEVKKPSQNNEQAERINDATNLDKVVTENIPSEKLEKENLHRNKHVRGRPKSKFSKSNKTKSRKRICSNVHNKNNAGKKPCINEESPNEPTSDNKKPRLPTVKCEECGKNICANYLKKHYILMHKEKCRMHTCVFCDFMTLEKCDYLKHMRTHTGNKPHVCRECTKAFARAELLKDHIMKVHKNEKHKCKICDKEFSSVAALRSHKNVVHEKKKRKKPNRKPKVCSICGHTFWMSGDLRAHEMAHRGEKPFKCEQCDLRFTTKSHLKKHQIVHTDEKPFKCSFCDFASNRKANLRAHIRRHTGELPFKCDLCDDMFRVSNQLKMHKLKIHGVDMTMEAMKTHGGIDLRRKPSVIPETKKAKKKRIDLQQKMILPSLSTKAKEYKMGNLGATMEPDKELNSDIQAQANTSVYPGNDLSEELNAYPELAGIEEQTLGKEVIHEVNSSNMHQIPHNFPSHGPLHNTIVTSTANASSRNSTMLLTQHPPQLNCASQHVSNTQLNKGTPLNTDGTGSEPANISSQAFTLSASSLDTTAENIMNILAVNDFSNAYTCNSV